MLHQPWPAEASSAGGAPITERRVWADVPELECALERQADYRREAEHLRLARPAASPPVWPSRQFATRVLAMARWLDRLRRAPLGSARSATLDGALLWLLVSVVRAAGRRRRCAPPSGQAACLPGQRELPHL